MHVPPSTFERYLDDTLDPRTRTALDSHIAICLPCAQALADAGARDGMWERRGPLGRLVRVGRFRDVV
jgi:hypothetical protein